MLSRRVVRHLLDAGKVAREQVDEAVRMQGFFGGHVESHLLKLGYVDEGTLGAALTEASGVPYASAEHLRAIPDDAMRGVPSALLEKHRVCPFRVEDGRLRVAMLDPRDRAAITDLQGATGYVVEPWITSEFRLYQALERYYRVRFDGVKAISLAPPALPRDRRRSVEAPSGASDVPEIGLDGLPLDAEAALETYVSSPSAPSIYAELGAPQGDAPPSAPAPPLEILRPVEIRTPIELPPLPRESLAAAPRATEGDVEALDDSLGAARDRDGVATALLEFCGSRAARAALFAVGRDGVRGVAGRGRGFDTASVRRVELPVRSGTVFETALGSRDFYFGVVPALPPNRDLYTALGGRIPAMVLIVPIVVKDRTAALLYLDGDDAPLLRPDITAMRKVAAKAGIAFEIVLLRNKLRAI